MTDFDALLTSPNGVVERQYRQLQSLCHEAVAELGRQNADPHASNRILNDIVPLMRQCFRTEEALLRENACATLEMHIRDHQTLESEMTDLLWLACFDLGDAYRNRFKRFVSAWLQHCRSEMGMRPEG